MSWKAITEADVLTKMSGPELEAFRSAAIAAGQADPITGAINNVTELVRGYVASNPKNDLDLTNTNFIPTRLIPAAVDILVVDIPARAAGIQIDPDDARAKSKTAAIKLLEQTAAGKFSIADPVSGVESNEAVTPSYTPTRTRRYDRANQDGI